MNLHSFSFSFVDINYLEKLGRCAWEAAAIFQPPLDYGGIKWCFLL